MSPVSLLLNIIWIVLGGAWMAFGWLVAAVIMAITIVGLPWARAAFNIAAYTLFPFGFTAVSRDAYTGQEDIGTGPLGVIGNIIWLVLAGWWLALGHVVTAVAAGRHHHRHSLCLGTPQARRHRAVADRQGHRSGVSETAELLSFGAGYEAACSAGGFSRSNSASLISVWATSTLQRRRLTR